MRPRRAVLFVCDVVLARHISIVRCASLTGGGTARRSLLCPLCGGHTPWRPEDASLRPSARSIGNCVADPSPGPIAGTCRQRDRAANEGRGLSSRGRARSTGLQLAQEVCAGVRLGIRRLSTVRGIQVGGTTIRECNIERHGAEHGREGKFVPHFRDSSFAELSSDPFRRISRTWSSTQAISTKPSGPPARRRAAAGKSTFARSMNGGLATNGPPLAEKKRGILSKKSGSCLQIDLTPTPLAASRHVESQSSVAEKVMHMLDAPLGSKVEK
jgi:hypothetical protein